MEQEVVNILTTGKTNKITILVAKWQCHKPCDNMISHLTWSQFDLCLWYRVLYQTIFGLHRVISYICICSITSGISPTLRLPAKSRGGYIGIYSSVYSLVKIVHYDWSEYLLLSFYYLFLTRFLVCKVIKFLTVIYTGKDVVCVMTANFKCIFFFYLNTQAFLEECPVILYLY